MDLKHTWRAGVRALADAPTGVRERVFRSNPDRNQRKRGDLFPKSLLGLLRVARPCQPSEGPRGARRQLGTSFLLSPLNEHFSKLCVVLLFVVKFEKAPPFCFKFDTRCSLQNVYCSACRCRTRRGESAGPSGPAADLALTGAGRGGRSNLQSAGSAAGPDHTRNTVLKEHGLLCLPPPPAPPNLWGPRGAREAAGGSEVGCSEGPGRYQVCA